LVENFDQLLNKFRKQCKNLINVSQKLCNITVCTGQYTINTVKMSEMGGIPQDSAGFSEIQRDSAGFVGIQQDSAGFSRTQRDSQYYTLDPERKFPLAPVSPGTIRNYK
jgi:hypothetical protein